MCVQCLHSCIGDPEYYDENGRQEAIEAQVQQDSRFIHSSAGSLAISEEVQISRNQKLRGRELPVLPLPEHSQGLQFVCKAVPVYGIRVQHWNIQVPWLIVRMLAALCRSQLALI